MSTALLLIGVRALALRERLEASGYDTLGWSGADAEQSLRSGLVSPQRVQAVIVSSDELLLLPQLQQLCGAGEQVPLLLEVEADDLEARKLVLKLGANDFWLPDAPPQRAAAQIAAAAGCAPSTQQRTRAPHRGGEHQCGTSPAEPAGFTP